MRSSYCVQSLSPVHRDNTIRLVCFPHAGAGASIFHEWTRLLGSTIELLAVQLPGREQRSDERLQVEWSSVISEIADALVKEESKKTVFYGHSLGGLIACEVSLELQRRGQLTPALLVVGGAYAPSTVCKDKTRFHDMPSLREAVQRLGGVPDELFLDPGFAEHFLDVIAADFTLFNKYQPTPSDFVLDCPLVALYGTDDPDHGLTQAQCWRLHSAGAFATHAVVGGHFFHREKSGETVSLIQAAIAEYASVDSV